MDKMINALKAGGRVVLSSGQGFTVAAERSGDGKLLRIVRESAEGFQVIKTQAF